MILEDARVRLTPLAQEDFDKLLPFSLNEPEIWEHSFVSGAGAENLQKYITQALLDRDQGHGLPFLVYDKATNNYVGSTRFYNINATQQTAMLGYTWYGKAFRGSGINKHCKHLLLKYGFENLHLERIEFRVDNTNKRSLAALKSIGCTLEGVLRSDVKRFNNSRRDSAVLSILKSEWNNGIKSNIEAQLQSFK